MMDWMGRRVRIMVGRSGELLFNLKMGSFLGD